MIDIYFSKFIFCSILFVKRQFENKVCSCSDLNESVYEHFHSKRLKKLTKIHIYKSYRVHILFVSNINS